MFNWSFLFVPARSTLQLGRDGEAEDDFDKRHAGPQLPAKPETSGLGFGISNFETNLVENREFVPTLDSWEGQ
jgi:hypothetical protein